MKIGFWNYYSSLNASLFTDRNAPIGDDLLLPFMRLREAGERRGISCEAIGADNLAQLDALVFIDYPDRDNKLVADAFATGKPRYLLVFEPPHVRPENHSHESDFARIFTWDDRCVGERYVKLSYAQEFPEELPPAAPRKPLTMIAAAKHSQHPASLYHRRREIADFFDRFSADPVKSAAFDLYGPGWNGHAAWRGVLPPGRKREALAGYRYAVVFENGQFPGYITEKLFDCFIAGTVPLYLGAPNIRDYVPDSCYVDLAQFGETWTRVGRMWEFVQRQTDGDYLHQHLAISSFLTSEAAEQFTTRRFAKTILDTIEGDLTVI